MAAKACLNGCAAESLWAGDQPDHLRHGAYERLHPRHRSRDCPGRYHAQSALFTGRWQPAAFDLVTANPMWNQNFPPRFTKTTPSSASAAASRPAPAPIGAGSSTWWLRWNPTGAWRWCWIPERSRAAAATRARTVSATSASCLSRETWQPKGDGRSGHPAAGEPVLQHHRPRHRDGDQQGQAASW
jgi:hypothetical protein